MTSKGLLEGRGTFCFTGKSPPKGDLSLQHPRDKLHGQGASHRDPRKDYLQRGLQTGSEADSSGT